MNLSGSAIQNHVGWLNGSIMVGCLVHELGINHGHERFATGIADPEPGMLADCKFSYGSRITTLVQKIYRNKVGSGFAPFQNLGCKSRPVAKFIVLDWGIKSTMA